MRKNTKMLAILSVFAMLVVSIVPIMDDEGVDAESGVLESMYAGSWTWDTATGRGPFNSFYGAFDIDNGNSFYAILNPMDLTKTISGDALPSSGHYNIMWIIPTVYWQVDTNGNLEVSNDPSKGAAYAHTIDGKVYRYIAIGVYEATTDANNHLSSESGKMPTVSKTRGQFREMASQDLSANLGSGAYAMQWNFYQWELYKYLSLITMEGFNSQNIVGWGHTYGSTYAFTTGSETDTLGPYAGKISSNVSNDGNSSAKLYLENTWGGVYEFVDGIIYGGGSTVYIDTNHKPTDATAAGTNVESLGYTFPSGFPDQINTTDKLWGLGTNTSGNATVGLTDRSYGDPGTRVLYVGGTSNTTASGSVYCGLSCAYASYDTSYSYSNFGSRLAFVFDSGPLSPTPENYNYVLEYDASKMGQTAAQETQLKVAGMKPISHDAPPTYTVTIQSENTDYGTVNASSVTQIDPGTTITLSGTNNETLTITGKTSVIATPNTATAKYTYAFTGWYVGDTPIQSGDEINANTTITAKFSQTINSYDISVVAGNYGVVNASTISSVPYDSSISINSTNRTMTINDVTVTATPNADTAEYEYGFDGWYVGDTKLTSSSKTTDNMTITARFTRTTETYTIHFVVNGSTMNRTYEYGTAPEEMTNIPTPSKSHYDFVEWIPALATVTAEATYTAVFTPTVYTITWNPNGGTVSPTTSTGTIETAAAVPIPTLDYNIFQGWYTQATGGTKITEPYKPTADVELFAHWVGIEYTVEFDATTNGGTTETTTLTATNMVGITLPEATKEGQYFDGWWTAATGGDRVGFTDDVYHPTSDITLYARFTDTPIYTFSVNFNLDGGYGYVTSLTYSSESPTAYTFTLPDVTPKKYLLTFLGWSESKGDSEAEYVAGDTVSVSANDSITLYAVWYPTPEHDNFKAIIDVIPILMVVGLLVGIATLFFTGHRNGRIEPKTIVQVTIGTVVAIVVIALFVVPLLSGL